MEGGQAGAVEGGWGELEKGPGSWKLRKLFFFYLFFFLWFYDCKLEVTGQL